jgi:hypothetical protein
MDAKIPAGVSAPMSSDEAAESGALYATSAAA